MKIALGQLRRSVFCLFVVGCAASATAQSVPEKPLPYPETNADYRDFLVKAKRAEQIKDPLKRCLAYPDYPGNRWPKNLAAAYCRYALEPAISLDEVRGYLDRHALAALDARFKSDLDRHFSKSDFSEIIHFDLQSFDGSVTAGQLSLRWIELAPKSPYALAARGEYFRSMASKARGAAWAADTPPENMQRMSEFAGKAIDSFRQALVIEPRLLEADVGTVNVSSLDSRQDTLMGAFTHAMKVDPACKVMATAAMRSLEPRWGGSYAAMSALAVKISPYVERRPLLALSTVEPQMEAAHVASREDSYDAAVGLIRSVLLESANADAFNEAGVWMDHATTADRWEQLVILLEAARFKEGTKEGSLVRGRLLLNLAQEPKWAIASLRAAVRLDPEDAYAHYLLGAAYWNSGSPSLSEPDYLAAMRDVHVRQDALLELTKAMLQARELAKARKYVDLLNKEYPALGPGWLTRGSVLIAQGVNGEPVTQALRKFVATADPNDLRQIRERRRIEGILKQIDHPSTPAAKHR
jgi:hypothetical protein